MPTRSGRVGPGRLKIFFVCKLRRVGSGRVEHSRMLVLSAGKFIQTCLCQLAIATSNLQCFISLFTMHTSHACHVHSNLHF